MRFALFTALAVSAASAVYAVPMENSAELVTRQTTCNIATCATGLLGTIPGLLSAPTADVPLLLSCLTNLLISPSTAVPTCLVSVVLLTGALPTGCVTSCLPLPV